MDHSTFMLKYYKEINKLKADKNDKNNRGIRTEGLNTIYKEGLKELNNEEFAVTQEFFKVLLPPLLDSISEKVEKNRGTAINILSYFIDKLNLDDEFNTIIPELLKRINSTPYPETCIFSINM